MQIRIKAVLLRTGACGLGMQVALGHAQIVGTKEAIARAWPGLGDNSDGRHARGRATRLHTQDLHQALLELGRDIPRGPTLVVLAFDALVKRQQAALREHSFIGTLAACLGMYQLDEPRVDECFIDAT